MVYQNAIGMLAQNVLSALELFDPWIEFSEQEEQIASLLMCIWLCD